MSFHFLVVTAHVKSSNTSYILSFLTFTWSYISDRKQGFWRKTWQTYPVYGDNELNTLSRVSTGPQTTDRNTVINP